jgi:flavin-dependent dehydrogenase
MNDANVERQQMAVDIACVGFGPASGGFLTTLERALAGREDHPAFQSRAMPGMPLQVVCYERADDLGFGVSGVATRARAIRASFPDLDPAQIPMTQPITEESLVYLLDPIGASRRSPVLRAADRLIRAAQGFLPFRDDALRLPFIPSFLRKDDGLLLSIGQFNQWVGSQLMGSGRVQLWPGMPVDRPLIEKGGVAGVRLVDQGTDAKGGPEAGYMPGIDVRAALTVIADGPVAPSTRLGGRHEDGRRSSRRFAAAAGNGDPHVRLSRTGDLRLPLRLQRPLGVARHLRSVVARQPGPYRLPLSAALDDAPLPVARPARRHHALVGREVAAGIGAAR